MERRAGEGQLLPTLASLVCCFIFLVTLVNAYELEDIAEIFRRDVDVGLRVFGHSGVMDSPTVNVPVSTSSENVDDGGAVVQVLKTAPEPEDINITIDLSIPNRKSHLASYTILSETWDLLAGKRFEYSAAPIPAVLYAGEKLTVSVGDSFGNIAHCRLPEEVRSTWQHYLEVGKDIDEGDKVKIITYDADYSVTKPQPLLCIYEIDGDIGLREFFNEEGEGAETDVPASTDEAGSEEKPDDEDPGLRRLVGEDDEVSPAPDSGDFLTEE